MKNDDDLDLKITQENTDEKQKPKKFYQLFSEPLSFGEEYEDGAENIKHDNKSLWFMILVLMVLITMLMISNNSLAKKTVLSVDLPPRLYALEGKVDVTADDANDLYYQAHGQYLIRETADFSLADHERKLFTLGTMMAQSRYVYKEVDFINEITFIKTNNISQKIIATGSPIVRERQDDGLVIVKLDVTVQQVVSGMAEAQAKQCSYEIALFRQDWKIFVHDYRTDCFASFGFGGENVKK